MKTNIRKNREFLLLKQEYESKGSSLSKIARGLGMTNQGIYKAFHSNYRPTIEKVINYVEKL